MFTVRHYDWLTEEDSIIKTWERERERQRDDVCYIPALTYVHYLLN